MLVTIYSLFVVFSYFIFSTSLKVLLLFFFTSSLCCQESEEQRVLAEMEGNFSFFLRNKHLMEVGGNPCQNLDILSFDVCFIRKILRK